MTRSTKGKYNWKSCGGFLSRLQKSNLKWLIGLAPLRFADPFLGGLQSQTFATVPVAGFFLANRGSNLKWLIGLAPLRFADPFEVASTKSNLRHSTCGGFLFPLRFQKQV